MSGRKPKAPALQVLFEPWPASANANRDGYEAFAGQYLLDALDVNGTMKVRGFRAVVQGCTTCRRDEKDPRVHVPDINDLKPGGSRRRCPQWKRVESIVKAFGGWKASAYAELDVNEGLGYQPIPQRRREVVACEACGGTGLGKLDDKVLHQRKQGRLYLPCDAGCGSYGYGEKGQVQRVYEGPVRPDRHSMTDAQRRTRS